MTFQAIRDLHTQSQSTSSWDTYLASRKALKNQDRASPSEDADLHRASLVQKKAGEAGKVGHNKCCDKKRKYV